MATTLLRTSLRFVTSNGFFEKRTVPVLFGGAMQVGRNNDHSNQKFWVNFTVSIANNENSK